MANFAMWKNKSGGLLRRIGYAVTFVTESKPKPTMAFQNNDPEFLEFLHQITLAGYEIGITIPAHDAHKIEELYESGIKPSAALSEYIKSFPAPASANVESFWQQYLERVKLSETKMAPDQLQETKRAFYGAAGIMLVYFKTDVAEMDDNTAVATFMALESQVGEFWKKQV